MRPFKLIGYALNAVTAIWLFSGCSEVGSPPPPAPAFSRLPVPTVLPGRLRALRAAPAIAGRTWMTPELTRPAGRLYVSGYSCNCVKIYALQGTNQQPIGEIGGLANPQGLFTDRRGRLWIANTGANDVLAYSPGTPVPPVKLSDPKEYPVDVAVHYDGTVYVANIVSTNYGPGNVVVYAKGATSPTQTLTDPNFSRLIGVTVDPNKNVFVTYVDKSDIGRVDEFAAGSTSPVQLPITTGLPGGIVFDSAGNLVTNDQLGRETLVYAPGSWTLTNQFGKTSDPLFLGFAHDERNLYVADGSDGVVYQYAYPSGMRVNTISAGWSTDSPPVGIAVAYPAPL
jgi:sugar lactone lactonase YvrE